MLEQLEGLDPTSMLMSKQLIQYGINEKNSKDATNLRESYAQAQRFTSGVPAERFSKIARKELKHKLWHPFLSCISVFTCIWSACFWICTFSLAFSVVLLCLLLCSVSAFRDKLICMSWIYQRVLCYFHFRKLVLIPLGYMRPFQYTPSRMISLWFPVPGRRSRPYKAWRAEGSSTLLVLDV